MHEPVIYLVVWSTVATAQGGAVGGYTPGAFAAYYIVWTLVRNMNIVFTPYGWEGYIQRGQAGFPKQATKTPWKLYQNYIFDKLTLRFASVKDGTMTFHKSSDPA